MQGIRFTKLNITCKICIPFDHNVLRTESFANAKVIFQNIFSQVTGRRPASVLKCHSSQVLFKHFANKNQLSGLSISGTLVKNELILCKRLCNKLFVKGGMFPLLYNHKGVTFCGYQNS